MENTKRNCLVFKGSWNLTYFWHSSWHYFGYISGKIARPQFLEKPDVSQDTSTFISIGMPIRKELHLKNMKNMCFFWRLFFQIKKLLTFGIFNESNIRAKVYYIKKNEAYGSAIVEIAMGRRSCYFISLNIV